MFCFAQKCAKSIRTTHVSNQIQIKLFALTMHTQNRPCLAPALFSFYKQIRVAPWLYLNPWARRDLKIRSGINGGDIIYETALRRTTLPVVHKYSPRQASETNQLKKTHETYHRQRLTSINKTADSDEHSCCTDLAI